MLVAAIAFTSCTKDKEIQVSPPTKTESDIYALEHESNSVDNMIEASLSRSTNTRIDTFICDSDEIVAPGKLVFDFDQYPSCDNRTYSGGKITAYFSGSKSAGTYRDSVVYDNVKLNGRTVNGKHATKQVKSDGSNSWVFSITVRKAITLEDGNVITWNSTRTRTIFGASTPETKDNLTRVEGSGTAKGVNGEDYKVEITSPIQYFNYTCDTYPRLPLQGKVTFTNNKDKSVRTVNFGIGECDNIATYTNKLGEITFQLK